MINKSTCPYVKKKNQLNKCKIGETGRSTGKILWVFHWLKTQYEFVFQRAAKNDHNHYRAHLQKTQNYRDNYAAVLGLYQNTPVTLYTAINVFTLEKQEQVKTHCYQWPGPFWMIFKRLRNFSCKCWTWHKAWKL